MENKMFCWQCQETAGNKGCTQSGVCGKDPKTAGVQDLLIYVTKGISAVATGLRAEGKTVSKEINHLVTQNLFTTITNANFDRDDIAKRVSMTLEAKQRLLSHVSDVVSLPEAALWNGDEAQFDAKAFEVGVLVEFGLHCFGCPASQMETLEQASEVHGFDVAELLEELNARVR